MSSDVGGGVIIQDTPTPGASKRRSRWDETPSAAMTPAMTPSMTPAMTPSMTPSMTPGGGAGHTPVLTPGGVGI